MAGVNVSLTELERLTNQLLQASGLNEENAAVVTDVFMRATCRGVGHHDVYDLPGRIAGLTVGKVKANPSITRISKYGGLENYEGDNGLGELCGMFIMRRAEQLADEHGIGLCAIRNSNHLLASTPYVEAAADRGYISYIVTRGAPTMGALPGQRSAGNRKQIISSGSIELNEDLIAKLGDWAAKLGVAPLTIA